MLYCIGDEASSIEEAGALALNGELTKRGYRADAFIVTRFGLPVIIVDSPGLAHVLLVASFEHTSDAAYSRRIRSALQVLSDLSEPCTPAICGTWNARTLGYGQIRMSLEVGLTMARLQGALDLGRSSADYALTYVPGELSLEDFDPIDVHFPNAR
jgi:hypothetical protein